MDYKVKFSARKTVSIKITPSGDIEVFAPYKTPSDKIEEFLNLKQKWIVSHQTRIKSVLTANKEVIEKKKMYLFGELVDYTAVAYKNLIKTAKSYLNDRCLELSKTLNLPINGVKIKNFKSRWGSCDAVKNVSLNFKLIMLPKSTIDYVIIHELCHTVYFNHQKNFHNLLTKLTNNEKYHKKLLKYYNFVLKIY